MTSLDYRTRPARRIRRVDPAEFCRSEWPARLRENGRLAAGAAARLGLPPLTLEVEGAPWTVLPADGTLRIERISTDGALVARLDADAFSDLVDDHKSTLGLSVSGRIEIVAGEGEQLLWWEPVLRAALDGRPVHAAGDVTVSSDLSRHFTPDSPLGEMRSFLVDAGFLHLRGVFTGDEMAGVGEDLDRSLERACQDDGTSWWVRTRNGEHRPSRILNFLSQSDRLRTLVGEDRFLALGDLAGLGHLHSDSFGEHFAEPSAEGLIKPVGVTEGISDLGWHKDCARGGHSRFCCGLTIGIAVTGADEESGELRVVAGSHRANLPGAGLAEDVGLPVVALPTLTGDVTVHCSCTLHEARPPIRRERKVVYTGLGLPPRPGDEADAADHRALRRERAEIGRMR